MAIHRDPGGGNLLGGSDGQQPQNSQQHPEPVQRPEAHPHSLPHVHLPQHTAGTVQGAACLLTGSYNISRPLIPEY